jgi:hypothetical protein
VNAVSTRDQTDFAAQWLAYTLPCRRFAGILADACARLGADVGRYSFIAVDFHHILLAGLPAHSHTVAARSGCTKIPLAAGWFGWTRPFLFSAFQAMPQAGSSTRILRIEKT